MRAFNLLLKEKESLMTYVTGIGGVVVVKY